MRTNKADWPKQPIKERECSGCNGTGFMPVVRRKSRGDVYSHHAARSARVRVEFPSGRKPPHRVEVGATASLRGRDTQPANQCCRLP